MRRLPGWRTAAKNGPPRYGATDIPFLGQLRAVTGSGKTPILAEVVGGLGDAVVLLDDTVECSRRADVHQSHRQVPITAPSEDSDPSGHSEPARLERACRVVQGADHLGLDRRVVERAEADADESGEARLRLRREHQDWAGTGSPWDQLRKSLHRPLWIVSDESHNQSAAQLDQLAALRPKGFFMASATPVVNDLFAKWADALEDDQQTRALLHDAQVPVLTRDVVDANLLKTTIELIDYRSGAEESLDGALSALEAVEHAAEHEGAGVAPRAIYVVEKSNPSRGSHDEPRPVVIWRHLRGRGVPADEIAIFTDTKVLPNDAERVASLSQLSPNYRHIIFNQSLQEGWDDPEAYVCYFDGVTKSFVRIRQIVGRVLRQPTARRFQAEELNTATLILQTPASSYDAVVSELRAELRLYAPPGEPAFSAVRLKTRKQPLDSIPVKRGAAKKLELPRHTLKAPPMRKIEKELKMTGKRVWPAEGLNAPGTGRKARLALSDGSAQLEYIAVLRSARTQNATFLRNRLLQRNRACVNAIHPDWLRGPAFDQQSCHGSQAQEDLLRLAAEIIDYFEDRVTYQQDPDPERLTWRVGEYRPRGTDFIEFDRGAHRAYAVADFNPEERSFAVALDRVRGVIWTRNPPTASPGYGIPLPKKAGDSSTFYPDFIAAKGGDVWAIDTTGRHLLDGKVRGKLVALGSPKMALVVKGEVDLGSGSREGKDGWTLLIARPNLKPLLEHSDDLDGLLKVLFTGEY